MLRSFDEDKSRAIEEASQKLKAEFDKQLPATQAQLIELQKARVNQEERLKAAMQQIEMLKLMRQKDQEGTHAPASASKHGSATRLSFDAAAATASSSSSSSSSSSAVAAAAAAAADFNFSSLVDNNNMSDASGDGGLSEERIAAERRLQDALRSLAALQQDHARLQADYADHRTERAENQRRLQASLDASRSAESAAKVQAEIAAADLKFATSRLESLSTDVALYKNEIDVLRTKHAEHMAAAAAQQRTAQQTMNELSTTREALHKAQLDLTHVRAEKDRLAANDTRLTEENTKLAAQQDRHERLLSSLQSMQQALVHKETEALRRLVDEKAQVQVEWAEAKKQLDTDRQAHRDALRLIEHQRDELRVRWENSEKRYHEQREATFAAQAQTESAVAQTRLLEEQRASLTTEVARLQLRLTVAETANQTPKVKRLQELEADLAAAQEEVARCSAEITAAQQEAIGFRRLAEEHEASLRAHVTVTEEYKQRTEQDAANALAHRMVLQSRVDELVEACKAGDLALDQLRSSTSQRISELESERDEARTSVAPLTARVAQLESMQTQLQADIATHVQSAQDAQSRYHHELGAHADTARFLNTTRADLTRVQNEADASALAVTSLSAKLAAGQEQWAQQRTVLEQQLAQNATRLQELTAHNELLLAQYESLTSHAQRFQEELTRGAEQATVSVSADNKAIQDLREIVRFLRGEKERAEATVERQAAEVARLKHEAERAQRAVTDLQAQVATATKTPVASATAPQSDAVHQSLVSHVQQLNVLHESNALLRDESQRLQSRVQALERDLVVVRNENAPLHKSIRDLHAERDVWHTERESLLADNRRWKERTEHVLTKYNQIDPVVHQQLQVAHDALAAQLATLQADQASLQSLKDAQAKCAADLKSETAKHAVTLSEKGRLTTQIEMLKKRLDDAIKSKGDTVAVAKLQEAESARVNAEARVVKMTALLQDARTLLQRKTEEVAKNRADIQKLIERIKAEQAKLIERTKEWDGKREADIKTAVATAVATTKDEAKSELAAAEGRWAVERTTLTQQVSTHATRIQSLSAQLNAVNSKIAAPVPSVSALAAPKATVAPAMAFATSAVAESAATTPTPPSVPVATPSPAPVGRPLVRPLATSVAATAAAATAVAVTTAVTTTTTTSTLAAATEPTVPSTLPSGTPIQRPTTALDEMRAKLLANKSTAAAVPATPAIAASSSQPELAAPTAATLPARPLQRKTLQPATDAVAAADASIDEPASKKSRVSPLPPSVATSTAAPAPLALSLPAVAATAASGALATSPALAVPIKAVAPPAAGKAPPALIRRATTISATAAVVTASVPVVALAPAPIVAAAQVPLPVASSVPVAEAEPIASSSSLAMETDHSAATDMPLPMASSVSVAEAEPALSSTSLAMETDHSAAVVLAAVESETAVVMTGDDESVAVASSSVMVC